MSTRRFEALVVALLVWGAVSFGGAYPWGYWSIAIWASLLGGWVLHRTKAWRDPTVRAVAWPLGAVALGMTLQTIPLVHSAFLVLNPAADDVLQQISLAYLAEPPRWHPLSLVPAVTLTATAVFVGLSLFLLGLTHVMARLRIERLVVAIMTFGAMLAVFAVMQRAANVRSPDGWQLVYGFWKPRQAGDVFGPFINRNHFAGWMLMALPLALGYSCFALEASGLSVGDGWRRWIRWTTRPEASRFMTIALAVVAMGAALTASGSRSGIAAFAVAVAVMAYFVGRRLGRRRLRILAVAYLILLLAGAVGWAGFSPAARRFALASSDAGGRLSAWRDTLRIIRDFPVFGTGIGGYGQAMRVYQTANRDILYAQAHNDYLQIAAEGGVLVGLPAVICLLGLVRGIRGRLTDGADKPLVYWVRAGAMAGLAGIAVQSFLDFSLQLAGNTVLCVFLVAVALHRPLNHAPRI